MPLLQFRATLITPQHRRKAIKHIVDTEIELQRLLRANFNSGSSTEMARIFDRFFTKLVSSIFGPPFQYHFGQFELLKEQLQRIEKSRQDLLEHFRKEFHKISEKQYFGWRLEVAVVSVLIDNDIRFTKPDLKPKERALPDVRIEDYGDPIKIEITSKHMEESEDRDLKYQVGRALRSKIEDDYCDERTAIFVDVTNILYYTIDNNTEWAEDEIKAYIRQQIEGKNVGSVYLFVFHVESERGRFSMNHWRIDNDCIDEDLQEFLNEKYDSDSHDYDGHAWHYASA